MKIPMFGLITSGVLVLSFLGSGCQAKEISPPMKVASCSDVTNSFVTVLKGKKLAVVNSSTTVERSDNPTARKKVLIFVVGPTSESTIPGVEEAAQAGAEAQEAVVSVTLAQIQSIMAGCIDVAEVHVGLQQSDFIREFVVTREAGKNKPPVVNERVCVDEGARTRWPEQHCL